MPVSARTKKITCALGTVEKSLGTSNTYDGGDDSADTVFSLWFMDSFRAACKYCYDNDVRIENREGLRGGRRRLTYVPSGIVPLLGQRLGQRLGVLL
jgi:hypothetical protein